MMKKGSAKQKLLLWSQFRIKFSPGKVLLSDLWFVLIVSLKESIFHRLCHLKVHIIIKWINAKRLSKKLASLLQKIIKLWL